MPFGCPKSTYLTPSVSISVISVQPSPRSELFKAIASADTDELYKDSIFTFLKVDVPSKVAVAVKRAEPLNYVSLIKIGPPSPLLILGVIISFSVIIELLPLTPE